MVDIIDRGKVVQLDGVLKIGCREELRLWGKYGQSERHDDDSQHDETYCSQLYLAYFRKVA